MYTPPKTNGWISKITIFERRYILKTIIFGIYVKFQRGTYYNTTTRNAKIPPSIPHPLFPPSTISPTSYTCHATIPPKTSRSQVLIILHRHAKVSNGLFFGGKVMEYWIQSIQQGNLSIISAKPNIGTPKKMDGLQKYDGNFHVQRKSNFQEFNQPFLPVFGEKKNSIPSEGPFGRRFLFLVAIWGWTLKWWVSPTTMG